MEREGRRWSGGGRERKRERGRERERERSVLKITGSSARQL